MERAESEGVQLNEASVATPVRDLLAPISCLLVLFAGSFKASPLLTWIPGDLTLLAALAVVAGVTGVLFAQGLDFKISPWALLLLAVIIPAWVLVPTAGEYASSKLSGMILTLLAVAGTLYLVRTPRRQQVWVWALFGVGIVLGLGLLLAPSAIPSQGGAHLIGSNTIATARISGGAFVVAFIFSLSLSGMRRYFTLIAAVTFGLILFASGSRGPFAAAVVAVLVVAFFVRTPGKFDRFVMLGLAAIGGVGYLFIGGGGGVARIAAVVLGESDATESRSAVWGAAVRAIVGDPFRPFGVGWGNFASVLDSNELLGSGVRQYPHNVILEIWVEGGFVPMLAISIFIVLSLWRLSRIAGSGYGAALFGTALFALGNAMVSGDVNGNRLLWVSLAVAWVVDARIGGWQWADGHQIWSKFITRLRNYVPSKWQRKAAGSFNV